MQFLIRQNFESPGQDRDSMFLAALLLSLNENNQSNDFKMDVIQYDFMAEMFKVRIKNDAHRFSTYRNCLIDAIDKAKASHNKAKLRNENEKPSSQC